MKNLCYNMDFICRRPHFKSISFSYENGMEMFCFGLLSTMNRFPARHQMKAIALENNIESTLCRFQMETCSSYFGEKTV